MKKPAGSAKPSARKPLDPRLKQALTIFGVIAGLFLLSNASFFLKRVKHRVAPPAVIPAPEQGGDPYLLKLAGTPNRLLIPALGVDAPVVEAATRTQAAYRVALREGVTHLPGTAEPGDVGNAYLFGHSSDLPWAPGDYKTVFALLPEIARGTRIYVTDADGNAFAYVSGDTRVVKTNDLSVTEDPGNGKRTLTLQTSYPIGTALRRFIVVADFEAEVLVK